ncbi:MAG TPA: 50S ribosomal protein L5 [Candidatus Paceibacterota bacterium]|nr:50S ribosomal protein L5 [Candidatus Paceibacterota bacterium]
MKQKTKVTYEDNKMREIFIEKLVLSGRGVNEELNKSFKLLKKISKKTPSRRISTKRIPAFNVRPKLEVGVLVTIRGKEIKDLLRRLLAVNDNIIKKKQVEENHFSFGIEEYIEIPGEEYDREIGIIGFEATVVFARKGKRVNRRKIKQGRLPQKQHVKKEEIIKFMEDNFKTKFK